MIISRQQAIALARCIRYQGAPVSAAKRQTWRALEARGLVRLDARGGRYVLTVEGMAETSRLFVDACY